MDQPMKEFCWFKARLLCELTKNRGILINEGTKNDPLIWLDRLAAIFGHTSSQVDEIKEFFNYMIMFIKVLYML